MTLIDLKNWTIIVSGLACVCLTTTGVWEIYRPAGIILAGVWCGVLCFGARQP